MQGVHHREDITLSDAQFSRISHLVRSLCGINLHGGKRELVKARLNKHLRRLGMTNFKDYLDHLRDDRTGTELTTMLDAISTNFTSFFREPHHFDILRDAVVPAVLARTGRLRVWSAGCASGEEAYSIALALRTHRDFPRLAEARILATDLSTSALSAGRKGVYRLSQLGGVSHNLLTHFFVPIKGDAEQVYQVADSVRSLVRFARLNLINPWPMRGPFDVVFCRNVMIYFDKEIQKQLVKRFWDILSPGGMLFLGHAESLAGVGHNFTFLRPNVYCKSEK